MASRTANEVVQGVVESDARSQTLGREVSAHPSWGRIRSTAVQLEPQALANQLLPLAQRPVSELPLEEEELGLRKYAVASPSTRRFPSEAPGQVRRQLLQRQDRQPRALQRRRALRRPEQALRQRALAPRRPVLVRPWPPASQPSSSVAASWSKQRPSSWLASPRLAFLLRAVPRGSNLLALPCGGRGRLGRRRCSMSDSSPRFRARHRAQGSQRC